MSNYDIFVQRCRRDPESDAPSIVLVEIQLKPATCVSVIIPLTFAMARVLPHSGVLSTVGYLLSLASRDMVPIDGVLWDSERLLLTPVHKLARAVARARFNDAPHHDPRPLSPDNWSRRPGDSFGSNVPNHRGEFADTKCLRSCPMSACPPIVTGLCHRAARDGHALAIIGRDMAMKSCCMRPKSAGFSHRELA